MPALAGAAFLVRDGQVPGERITVLERLRLAGGALDGIEVPEKGFVVRGGRELEDQGSGGAHPGRLFERSDAVPGLDQLGSEPPGIAPVHRPDRPRANAGFIPLCDGRQRGDDKRPKHGLEIFFGCGPHSYSWRCREGPRSVTAGAVTERGRARRRGLEAAGVLGPVLPAFVRTSGGPARASRAAAAAERAPARCGALEPRGRAWRPPLAGV
ncbi:oleate hydratase [Kitasatospora sp. NPDC004799]|uniref:oleate hydratase n=1 Tax=Kitasatospora sp. NPDC004799 TaxID=3154460 RepID=UPI0033AD3A6C